MTAVNARITRPKTAPSVSARSIAAWSAPRTLPDWRRIQNSIHVTTEAARSIARPSKTCSQGAGVAHGHEQGDAGDQAHHDRRSRPGPDPAEVAAVPRARQVREQDADDQGRLHAFAEAGQQAAGEGSQVHGWLLWHADAGRGDAWLDGALSAGS